MSSSPQPANKGPSAPTHYVPGAAVLRQTVSFTDITVWRETETWFYGHLEVRYHVRASQVGSQGNTLNQGPSPGPHLGQQVIHALTALLVVPAQNPKQTKYLDLRLG